MLDSNKPFAAAPLARADKTAADLCCEQLFGGLTIVCANCHDTDEGACVMQVVVAVSHNNGPFPALGTTCTATRVLGPNTNNAKTNMDSYTQHIFVMVNKRCPKLKAKNGLVLVLETFAGWLNTHMFTKKDGLTEKSSFCSYARARDFDRTDQNCHRKLGDIILLTEAIAIVKELFPTHLEKNTFETQIIPACFNEPHPLKMRNAFGLA
jgi:hypothetical protein